MLNLKKKDFDIIKKWGVEKNPFKAISDFTLSKAENRNHNKENNLAFTRYYKRRLDWTSNVNFRKYYVNAKRFIDFNTWNYLRIRKQYFQTPMGWSEMIKKGGNIIDLGCGDGDLIQNFVNFCEKLWKSKKISPKKINIIGIDLNESRIRNAQKFVKTRSQNIDLNFIKLDFRDLKKKFKKNYFSSAIVAGVYEILDEETFKDLNKDINYLVEDFIYVEDLFDKFPGGFPRINISKGLKKFYTKEKAFVFSEPLNKNTLADPKKIWPITISQNIFLKKVN